jgi:hypothetical protein
MSLCEHFFKVLSLYLEARIRIRNRIKMKDTIQIRIKVTSRTRIHMKVMRIRNTGIWITRKVRSALYCCTVNKQLHGTNIYTSTGPLLPEMSLCLVLEAEA